MPAVVLSLVNVKILAFGDLTSVDIECLASSSCPGDHNFLWFCFSGIFVGTFSKQSNERCVEQTATEYQIYI
jgi:hypothetical protein